MQSNKPMEDAFFASYDEVYETFDTMNLKEKLLTGLHACGFHEPPEIHQRGIVPFCKGIDVFEQAESNIRKTTTFCVGILQQLDYNLLECQGLVLTPTLEFVEEITMVMSKLGQYLGVKVHACGENDYEDLNIPQKNVHVVVGTPHHILAMLERRFLCPDHIKMFVLDEADVMSLYRCVTHQIYKIFGLLPIKVQLGVFSETMTPQVVTIARKLMEKPVKVVVESDESSLEGLKHFYVAGDDEEWKLEMVCYLYPRLVGTHSVIFVNSEKSLQLLAKKMDENGYKFSTYEETEKKSLPAESSGVLITMDMLPRNLFEFQVSSVVVNYDLPSYPKKYIRRIAHHREFRRGVDVINFLTMDDWSMFAIRSLYNFSLVPLNIDLYLKPMDTSLPPKGSEFSTKQDDSNMSKLMASEGDDSFASYDEVYETFDDMHLKVEILAGIYAYGFNKPSELQKKGIVPFSNGQDVLVQAESEPGKTATFCTAILQRLDCKLDQCQCIVLAPTGNLVREILRILRELGAHLPKLKVYACGEGESPVNDIRYIQDDTVLRKVFHVVVGTPFNVLKMFEDKFLCPDHIKMAVLDNEAYSTSFFRDEISKIFQFLPGNVQVGVFSESMSARVVEAFHLLRGKDKPRPVKIVVKKQQDLLTPLEGMTHFVAKAMKFVERRNVLLKLLDALPIATQCIIFVGSLYWAARLLVILRAKPKLKALAIHSDMNQTYRDMVTREFQTGSIDVLITTDHLARGFDIKVSCIINYDVTCSPSVYCQRISRFGRGGGFVINIVDEDVWLFFMDIHNECGVDFEELPLDNLDVLHY